jgi:hypothetical protein
VGVTKLMDYSSERNYNISIREGKTMDVINDVYRDKSILGIVALTDLNCILFLISNIFAIISGSLGGRPRVLL